MNELIREIAEQAEVYSYAEYDKKQTGYTREDFFRVRFAELIVKDCIKWVNDNVGLVDDEAKAEMLKHFGIEE